MTDHVNDWADYIIKSRSWFEIHKQIQGLAQPCARGCWGGGGGEAIRERGREGMKEGEWE